MSAYSWGVEISRMFINNMGNFHSIYSLGGHDLMDNTNYQLFISELKEHYTTSLLGRKYFYSEMKMCMQRWNYLIGVGFSYCWLNLEE